MNLDFKDQAAPRKSPTSIRSIKSATSSLPPDGPAHQARPAQPIRSTDAIGEKLYASIHGRKLVSAFERTGSVARVARAYRIKCKTVELALAERLADFKKAA